MIELSVSLLFLKLVISFHFHYGLAVISWWVISQGYVVIGQFGHMGCYFAATWLCKFLSQHYANLFIYYCVFNILINLSYDVRSNILFIVPSTFMSIPHITGKFSDSFNVLNLVNHYQFICLFPALYLSHFKLNLHELLHSKTVS